MQNKNIAKDISTFDWP